MVQEMENQMCLKEAAAVQRLSSEVSGKAQKYAQKCWEKHKNMPGLDPENLLPLTADDELNIEK